MGLRNVIYRPRRSPAPAAVDVPGASNPARVFLRIVEDWEADLQADPIVLVDAACVALIEGLETPSMRALAGYVPTSPPRPGVDGAPGPDGSARDGAPMPEGPGPDGADRVGSPDRDRVNALIEDVITELFGAPMPVAPPRTRRRAADTLRFHVVEVADPTIRGFQVLVYVNDVEITSAGAGLGMDPYDLIVPDNRLAARWEATTVAIARCKCGIAGCASTQVRILRDGDTVVWEWSGGSAPMNRSAVFPAAQYDDAVDYLLTDDTWETPERTAGRLILRDIDRDLLRAHGLEVVWAGNDHRVPAVFRVAMHLGRDYQVFVAFPWKGRGPVELSRSVCAALSRAPQGWRATWRAIRPSLEVAPHIAGPSWSRTQF